LSHCMIFLKKCYKGHHKVSLPLLKADFAKD
jgi:hypothetical protein